MNHTVGWSTQPTCERLRWDRSTRGHQLPMQQMKHQALKHFLLPVCWGLQLRSLSGKHAHLRPLSWQLHLRLHFHLRNLTFSHFCQFMTAQKVFLAKFRELYWTTFELLLAAVHQFWISYCAGLVFIESSWVITHPQTGKLTSAVVSSAGWSAPASHLWLTDTRT